MPASCPAQGIVTTLPAEPITDWSSEPFWESLDGRPATDGWEFVDGEIRLVKPRGANGSLLSPVLPPNFELSWQWKIDKRTNTGLKYRVRRLGKAIFNDRPLGIEYQIIDDDADSRSKSSTASIYGLVSPSANKTLHAVGEWNRARVVAIGDRIEHYLNGQLVASASTAQPGWEAAIALSKFYGAKDFGRPGDGDRFMLTDHGGKASFKDFQFTVREVPKQTAKVIAASPPYLGNGMRNSWADQDSIVLWTRTTSQSEMNLAGPHFIQLSTKQANKLAKKTEAGKLMQAQVPAGSKLSEMFGACPGNAGRVRLSYFPTAKVNSIRQTDWQTTRAESDFTAQWKLDCLKPGTHYAAIVEAKPVDSDEITAVVRGSFRTAPKTQSRKEFRFCMTTCHDFLRRDDGNHGHKIYPAMTAMKPDFVVHAGDIEYYDKPDPWAMTRELMRFKWQRIFALPNNRRFYSSTTSYFLKDDHDTLKNDSWPGQMYGSVSFDEGVQLFNEEQFPSHSPRYKTVRWGRDLQIWFLEGRDYRSPNTMPDGPGKTILGADQKAWLWKTLAESKAKFKVVVSPTPIVGPDRPNKSDNHANDVFQHEGDEIRKKLSDIDNVIVLCGDRHWQYASVDEKTNLWEFGCGPGSEKHQLGWKVGDERPTHRFLRVKGGFLSGQLTYPDDDKEPKLTLRHHSVTGTQESEFVFPVANQPAADPSR
ncbi:family 16 glycoside hydrolase [Stieleria marina]|uniref:family 16 glycoside hydrolase n=1 Tax=Stieleria marina TaxID=1930275 RepID=UPI003AF33954